MVNLTAATKKVTFLQGRVYSDFKNVVEVDPLVLMDQNSPPAQRQEFHPGQEVHMPASPVGHDAGLG